MSVQNTTIGGTVHVGHHCSGSMRDGVALNNSITVEMERDGQLSDLTSPKSISGLDLPSEHTHLRSHRSQMPTLLDYLTNISNSTGQNKKQTKNCDKH